jgi:DNA phosphorothioation-dependent restriction protein DptF
MLCDFVKELGRLRMSSGDSIDDAKSFGPLQKYLHVDRLIEQDLRKLIHCINADGRKTLLLLCGSSGDGKSHYLSCLEDGTPSLLDNFKAYNDAAESDRKDRTPSQTLSDRLSGFRDDELDKPGRNMIVAINLGILSNFIESDERKKFTKLAAYVEEKNILIGRIGDAIYEPDSPFQFISFGDYNLFSLTEQGIETDYLDQLLSRIFDKSSKNPFYQAYCQSGDGCPNRKRCPIRHNFEMLSDKTIQSNISKIICEVIIKDKSMVSTREVFNLIYDILVHPAFNRNDLCETVDSNFLNMYIQYSLPMLIYDYRDRSALIDGIHKLDILKERTQALDEFAIQFNVAENIEPVIQKYTSDTPYGEVLFDYGLNCHTKTKSKELKSKAFRMMTRLQRLRDKNAFDSSPVYSLYLKNLYWYNSGQKEKLYDLYQLVSRCVFDWKGKLDDRHICINNEDDTVLLYERLEITPYIDDCPASGQKTLEKFVSCLTVGFADNGGKSDPVYLDIDYSLFKLLHEIKHGYSPTAQDRNLHADFHSFVDSLTLLGNASDEIMLVDTQMSRDNVYIFRKNTFGYEFKLHSN